MSGKKRRGENNAPALFPFLAVLLCTIGALVLILVITVTNSHASARRDAESAMTEVKDTVDEMEVVSDELLAQRDSLKAQVERRRRDLADIEDHIQRLTKSLEVLADRIERIQAETSQTDTSKEEKEKLVDSLRKQIDEKKKELIEELDKQKKRKPAFAVIPYSGNNGTSRRPVYLECTKDGIVIQPEGLLISVKDLKPPFGPGNPLDAALRVLRLAYQQRDETFGITKPPYPLLLVRPDGIQTYALAREAMKGWDDQFGYELISSDMDLTFPASVPGLRQQLNDTVDIAKQRQQALIAMMPRGHVQAEEDNWDNIDAANVPAVEGSRETAGGTGFGDGSSSMQEWKLVQGMANSQVTNRIQSNASTAGSAVESMDPAGVNPAGVGPESGGLAFPEGKANLTGQYSIQQGANDGRLGASGGQFSSESSDMGVSGSDGTMASSGSDGKAFGKANGIDGSNTSSQSNGTSQVNSSQGGSGSSASGSLNPTGNTTPSQPKANSFTSGSATGNSVQASLTPEQNAELAKAKTATSNSNQVAEKGSKQSSSVPPASSPKAKHVNPDGDLKPISVNAGQDWAASRAAGKATPVTRTINVVALKDRWMLRSDVDPNVFEAKITMDEGPQQAGNQLAVVIRKRVDSWGLSLPGGYWSPTLTIEAASDAQQSVARLERLLEGSGIEIRVVPLTIPKRR